MSVTGPLVSVVLPTYERADMIGRSIQSVLNQSYENFELIVVDDGSTDRTEEVVQNFEEDHIRYVEHEENRGAPAARNTGIEAARGQFIAFQDSDDRWHHDKLEKQVRAFRDAPPEVGVVYTGMIRVEGAECKYLPYRGVETKEGDIQRSLARQNFISTPVAMVRRECFETVGTFDEETWPLSDWELWIRLSESFEFRLVDEVLVTSEIHADSISTDQKGLVRARAKIVAKHEDFFDANSLAKQLFYIGNGSMKLDESGQARRYFLLALRTQVRPRYATALCLSSLSPSLYSILYDVYKRAVDNIWFNLSS